MKKLRRILVLMIAPTLISCVGGNENSTNNPSYLNKNLEQNGVLKGIGNQVPVDESTTETDSQEFEIKHCSPDDNVCGILKREVSANFMASSNGDLQWVNPNVMVIGQGFTLKFGKNGAPKDFHLSRLFNVNLGNGNAGRIQSINTSDCDKLVSKGPEASTNKSCSISFDYIGMDKSFDKKNEIHFQFSGEDKTNILDFAFYVQNHKILEQNYANLSDDNANSSGINYMINPTQEADNSTLIYSNTYVNDGLTNHGLAEMIIPESQFKNDVSTIEITKSAFLSNSENLYFYNSYQTTCGQQSVAKDGQCSFLFTENSSESINTSHYGYLNYKYYQSNISTTQTTYSNQFVIGQGDIRSRDYDITSSNMHLELIKNNITDNLHDPLKRPIYTIPLEKFELKVHYDPKFYIGYQITDSGIEYAYGDDQDKFRSSLDVKPDNIECFTEPLYDSISENMDVTQIRCGVTITSSIPNFFSALPNQQPVGFQLYANYISPTQHKKIEQLIGNVTIHSKPGIIDKPEGDYRSSCSDISWWPDTQDLAGLCRADNGTNRSSSLNYSKCASGASVKNEHGILTCSQYKDVGSNSLPSGSYLGTYDGKLLSCYSASWDGKKLSGICSKLSGSQSVTGIGSTLQYEEECKAGSTVSVGKDGKMYCDVPKTSPSEFPKGSYKDSCRNIKWADNAQTILSARCKNSEGHELNTDLNYATCNKSPVGNRNGTLVCE